MVGFADIRVAQGKEAAKAYLTEVTDYARGLLSRADVSGAGEGEKYLRVGVRQNSPEVDSELADV